MILQRIASALRRQDWATVFIELVVVVVGLLLGLELNNWANDLKDRRQVEEYYAQLILDLETDIETGESGIETADRNIAMGELVYRAATQEGLDEVDESELARALVIAGFTERPFVTRHTYDELISTGSLRLIKDTEIKRALRSYYAHADFARQWDELIQHEQMRYRDAIRGILTPEQMLWVRKSLRPDPEPPPEFDRDYLLRVLRERPEILDSVSSIAAEQVRLRRNSESVTKYAAELIEMLSRKP